MKETYCGIMNGLLTALVVTALSAIPLYQFNPGIFPN